MAPIIYFLLFLFGLLLVIKGSDWFIDSAVWAAEVFHIPQLIIGATIISICTTLPETFVSATAAIQGQADMAAGNALGSIAVNTGLILAILITYSAPKIENRKEFMLNGFYLIFILIFLWCVGYFYKQTTILIGILLLIMMLLYILSNIYFARKSMDLDIHYDFLDEDSASGLIDPENPMPEGVSYDESENDFDVSIQTITRKLVFFVIGVTLVIIGSRLLVENGIQIAQLLHVPTFLIAVIFTSFGTSLPELVTTFTSAKKGVVTLGIGNIIGADILNIVQVIGVAALLSPIQLQHEKSILLFQLPLIIIMILFAVIPVVLQKKSLSRWNGVLLFLFYLVFITANILRESAPFIGHYFF